MLIGYYYVHKRFLCSIFLMVSQSDEIHVLSFINRIFGIRVFSKEVLGGIL